jgi:hypothetical protein
MQNPATPDFLFLSFLFASTSPKLFGPQTSEFGTSLNQDDQKVIPVGRFLQEGLHVSCLMFWLLRCCNRIT